MNEILIDQIKQIIKTGEKKINIELNIYNQEVDIIIEKVNNLIFYFTLSINKRVIVQNEPLFITVLFQTISDIVKSLEEEKKEQSKEVKSENGLIPVLFDLQGEPVLLQNSEDGKHISKEMAFGIYIKKELDNGNKLIKNIDASNLKFNTFNINGLNLENISFKNSIFPTGASIDNCLLKNIDARNTNFFDINIKNSELFKITYGQ